MEKRKKHSGRTAHKDELGVKRCASSRQTRTGSLESRELNVSPETLHSWWRRVRVRHQGVTRAENPRRSSSAGHLPARSSTG
jgi:transposase-like protein